MLCVPIGCFLSGLLCEPCGKRRAMQVNERPLNYRLKLFTFFRWFHSLITLCFRLQLVSVPMIFAWLLFHFAKNVNYLYVGLCLTGLSGGLMEAPVSLLYLFKSLQKGIIQRSQLTHFPLDHSRS